MNICLVCPLLFLTNLLYMYSKILIEKNLNLVANCHMRPAQRHKEVEIFKHVG